MDVVKILGVRVYSAARSEITRMLDDRANAGLVTRVAFLNANLSNIAARNRSVAEDLENFIVLNDGLGVDIARLVHYGKFFFDNLNGTDFTTEFLDTTSRRLRLFLLGATPDVNKKAASIVQGRWPQHKVVGCHDGFFDQSQESALSDMIIESEPDLVLVAMGNPRQERWVALNIPKTCHSAMAVGAWFDFITGTVPRAPLWARTVRAEWVYRFLLEPRRLGGRYIVGNLVFLVRVVVARFAA